MWVKRCACGRLVRGAIAVPEATCPDCNATISRREGEALALVPEVEPAAVKPELDELEALDVYSMEDDATG